MKIIQLTDLHIDSNGDATMGIDVRQNYLDALQKIRREENPDHLVITGDLCHTRGDRSVYEWVKDRTDLIGVPIHVLNGNHDEVTALSEVFGCDRLMIEGELYYHRIWNDLDALFLDTGKGYVSEAQMLWVDGKLQNSRREVVIFMHHPPLNGGVQFMEKNYPLRNREAFAQLLFSCPNPLTVFCGHYHAAVTVQQENVTMHIAPSTFYQIKSQPDDFEMDHHNPGYRVIHFEENGIRSEVRFVRT